VRGEPVIEEVSAGEAIGGAFRLTSYVVTTTVEGIGQIITGKRSVKELGGPLKIAKFSGEQASLGLLAFLWFLAVISINLGFINLLPIPMLDGGHLLLYMIEGVRRKPLRPEAQEWAFRTGLAALLALMVFVTFNDLASFGLWSKLGGLID
jgi:regulator of sigma E protease